METDIGKTVYAASKIASFEVDGATEVIAKAQHDSIHDSAIRRLNKRVVAVMEASPWMSENQARDEVIRKNGDLYRAAQIESGVETVTKSEPGSAVHQLSRAADSMVRTHRGISGHDEAYARVAAANPRLHAAALDELSDSDDDIGKGELVSFRKGNIRVNKNAVANDACERLQAIIERLKQSGMDGWAAELRAKQANPELWEMAMGAPDDAESLEPPQAITCRERGK